MSQEKFTNVSAAKLAKLKKQAEKMKAKFESTDKGNGKFDVVVDFPDREL